MTQQHQGQCLYDDIKWKHFPCYWPFVQGIHLSPVNSHKGAELWCCLWSAPDSSRNHSEPTRIRIVSKFDPHSGMNFKKSKICKKFEGISREIYKFISIILRMILAHSRCIPSRMQIGCSWMIVWTKMWFSEYHWVLQTRCFRNTFQSVWGAFGRFWQKCYINWILHWKW